MKKELVEKMKAAFVANHGKPVTKDSLLSVVIEQCAAVASEHYGDKVNKLIKEYEERKAGFGRASFTSEYSMALISGMQSATEQILSDLNELLPQPSQQ